MSDGVARDLERLAAQGDPEAVVKALIQRVRTGQLAGDRLHLAACFGDPASREACRGLGRETLAPPPDPIDRSAFQDWLDLIPRSLGRGWNLSDHELHMRMALAAAEAVATPAFRHVLDAVANWILVYTAAAHPRGIFSAGLTIPAGGYDNVRSAAVFAALTTEKKAFVGNSPKVLEYAARAGADALTAVQAELVPWLFGHSDPVRERVEARQPEAPE